MKLLIADDESLTKEGLISTIDWDSLGISEIFQADDGIKALDIARDKKPDIILSDIRMPRLNGIEMAARLEKILPDTSLIFMSGYSDKEYLKAAIKLKAIDYIEKPLNPDEVHKTLQEAILQRQSKLRTRKNESLYSIEASSHLALLLTKPYSDHTDQILELSKDSALIPNKQCYFTTYIIKLQSTDTNSLLMKTPIEELNSYLANFHLQAIYVKTHTVHHVFHLIGDTIPSSAVLVSVKSYFQKMFEPFGNYYIVKGIPVLGLSKVYDSYSSAVITLQNCFFFSPGTVLYAEDEYLSVPQTPLTGQSDAQLLTLFSECLLGKDLENCAQFLNDLFHLYQENMTVLPNQIKDLYYKLFMELNTSRQKLKLSTTSNMMSHESTILEPLENCFSYGQLHQLLEEQTNQLFDSLSSQTSEDSTIFLIKEYISNHYADEALSIKEISDQIFLSVPYACTYFKNQTGQTLNQYITEYRMERAMQLLSDARYQITDISAKVGYSNGNYFSKSFKKFTGLSPSKYREKILG